VVGVAGAAATVVAGAAPTCRLRPSNVTATEIEDLQYTIGEGPGIDAHASGRPVSEPDLGRPHRVRWPLFSGPASAAGAAALFAFPLRQGGVRMGALTLYTPQPGRLTDIQHGDALVMADVIFTTVLAMQSQAPPGALAVELEALAGSRAEVHQAAGMISVQLSVSVAEALSRLRARAFGDGVGLAALAAEVVARRVRFET
jgi:hypothetical protein